MAIQKITCVTAITILAGCASPLPKHETYDLINTEIGKAATEAKARPAQPDAVSAALLPALKIEMPRSQGPVEERFNLSFNNAPAQNFFVAIVSGTRYSMLVHPEVTGTISANLKNVTLFEALDAIREMYGYDYKVEGTRIYVKPLTMQTRIFQVNYLTGNRRGTSDIHVTSGSISDASNGSNTSGNASNNFNNGNNFPQNGNSNNNGTNNNRSLDSSKISTTSNSDFWTELRTSLEAIVGNGKEGRSVVISPQSGVVVVRGSWDELRNVAAYLKATQLSVERQVILEAKILEVQLNDRFQTGINWASFASVTGIGNNRVSTGFLSPGTTLSSAAQTNSLTSVGDTGINAVTSQSIGTAANVAGSLFGFAFQTNNFAALLSFLQTQGTVHVLSSPRIATMNNQKAVLKVGTDDFFVTNVSTTTTTGTATTTSPTVTLQSFFSGVALDVTPQIDEHGYITLHVHPSVSQVNTVNKQVDLGSAGGSLNLPLASSSVSETDSIIRGRDGQVVAIGGLMRQTTTSDRSQLPFAGDVPILGALFRNTNQITQKRELVILLKPTVIQGDGSWADNMLESQRTIQGMEPRRPSEQR